METTKSDLEKHIKEVSDMIEVPLEKHETTPGVGNCWYEACASLLKLNNIRTMSAKQLRKEVVDNIENCENFANVFEMMFKSDYTKLEEFKKQHHREGEFTDEPGVIVLATGYYLGVTIRVFSRTNSKKQPYTEHNPDQPVIFNIFHDNRSSGHFQSLMQPKMDKGQNNPEGESPTKNIEHQWTREEAAEDYINRFHTEQEIYKPTQTIRVGKIENIQKNDKPTKEVGNKKPNQPNTDNKANSENRKKTTADKETKDIEKNNSNKSNKNKNDQSKAAKIATPDSHNKQTIKSPETKDQSIKEIITKSSQKQGNKEEIMDIKTTEKITLKEKMETYAEVAKNTRQRNKQQEYRKNVLAFEIADEIQQEEEKNNLKPHTNHNEISENDNKPLWQWDNNKNKNRGNIKEIYQEEKQSVLNSWFDVTSKGHRAQNNEKQFNEEKNKKSPYKNNYETEIDEAKKQLDILSRKKEEFLEQNNKLLAEISDKEKEKSALANENAIKISELESIDRKIISVKSELLEANMSNNTKIDEAKKQLDILSKKKEEFLEQNNKLLADISDKEKEKYDLANENEIKISTLESIDIKINSLKSELLEANMSNNKASTNSNLNKKETTIIHPESKPREATEKKWSRAELESEITEKIKNGSKLNKEKAKQLLEMMKNNQKESKTIPQKRKITKEREREIMEHMENKLIDPQPNQQTSLGVRCPIACRKKIGLKDYTDHILECEKQIEDCTKCGKKFTDYDIHRDKKWHTNVKQRFSCKECMKALSERLQIANDHRNDCQDSEVKEIFTSINTPEHTGNQFQEAYNNDKEIKRIMKDDFKKRYVKYKNSQKNQTNSNKKIFATLGLIILIYMSTFMIMRTALSKTNSNKSNDKTYKPSTTNNELRNTQQLKEHNKSEQKDKPKWPTKEKDKRLQDNPPRPSNPIKSSVDNSHSSKESWRRSDNDAPCLPSPIQPLEESSQKNEEFLRKPNNGPLCLQPLEESSQNNEEFLRKPNSDQNPIKSSVDNSHSRLENRLLNLSSSPSSIEQLSLWIISHSHHFQAIGTTWFKELVKANRGEKLWFMNLVDEIIQKPKNKHPEFKKSWDRSDNDATYSPSPIQPLEENSLSNEEFLRKPSSDPLYPSSPFRSTENNSPGETFNNYNPKPHVTSATHNIIKHLETPIKTVINKQEKCGNSKEINRTIATTLPEYKLSAETRVHSLKTQLDQLTSVESRVHSLIAQLDLLANL